MQIIDDQWNVFAAKCVPAPPGSTQYEETRKGFFAGAITVMGIMQKLSSPEVPEDDFHAMMESIDRELHAFIFEQIQGGTTTEARSSVKMKVTPEVNRKIVVDKLRCESTGYDDESCLEVLNILGDFAPVGHALFRVIQKECNNQQSVVLTLRAMQLLPNVIGGMK